MKPEPRAVGAALGAAVLLGAVAGLGWLAIEQARSAPVDAARARVLARPAASAPPAPDATQRADTSPASATGRDPGPETGGAAAAARPTPGDIEICGVGVYRSEEDARRALQRLAMPDIDDALEAHLRRMAASPDAATRAAAWMGARDLEPLVQLALRGPDPTVYTMAQAACSWYAPSTRPRACQMVNAEQAARLDADNAAPWLVLVAHAHARSEADAAAAALHRASVASQIRYRELDFAPLAMAAVPREMPPLERLQLRIAIVGMQAALPLSHYATASQHCNAASVADANRRQTCAALAELMAGRGRTLLDLGIARQIGGRVGWPQERIEALRADEETLTHAMVNQTTSAAGGRLDCDSIARLDSAGFAHASPLGERAAAEQAVQRSGLSPSELKERFRHHKERWRSSLPPTEADAAASGAAEAAEASAAPTPAPSTDRSPAASTP